MNTVKFIGLDVHKKSIPIASSDKESVLGLTFIAFEGYEIIAQAGEEVVNPCKNINYFYGGGHYFSWYCLCLIILPWPGILRSAG